MTAEEDAQLIAREVVTLRMVQTRSAQLRADLLEQAKPETAAAFLREMALEALAAALDAKGRNRWLVSAALRYEMDRELRQRRRRLDDIWVDDDD